MKQSALIKSRAEQILPTSTSPKKLAAQTKKNLAFIRQKISELSIPWQDIDNSIAGSEATLMDAFDVFERDINEAVKYLEGA